MISNTKIPDLMESSLRHESIDFAVKAGRAKPPGQSLFLILFGTIWTLFTSVFIAAFFGPVILGGESHFSVNDVPTVASRDNLGPLLVPGLVIGLFLVIGIVLLVIGLYTLNQKGGYFAGTPQRLVHFYKGKIRSIDWEQFSGDILLSGKREKGNISLRMRSGKMVSSKNGPDRYVPEVIYITQIPRANEIEEICRKRIKENDPTPSIVKSEM
jgi:hypothetical protein